MAQREIVAIAARDVAEAQSALAAWQPLQAAAEQAARYLQRAQREYELGETGLAELPMSVSSCAETLYEERLARSRRGPRFIFAVQQAVRAVTGASAPAENAFCTAPQLDVPQAALYRNEESRCYVKVLQPPEIRDCIVTLRGVCSVAFTVQK